MAKSKAQRMREYRERKKAAMGDQWLKQERERVKGYFVPLSEMNIEKQEKTRQDNKRRQTLYRLRKKNKASADETADHVTDANPVPSTSENEVTSTTTGSLLTVRLPFQSTSKSSSGKKRVSRALAKSYRRIETLEDKNEELRKKLKTVQRRLNRYEAKKVPTTPRSKTDSLLKQAGIKPNQVTEIRKRLIYGECVSEEIKHARQAQEKSCKKKEIIHRVVSGIIIKKYRLKTTLEKLTNLNRRKSCQSKSVNPGKKSRLEEYRKRISDEVVSFLERDDNSRQLPGKADAVTVESTKVQKRVLNDYIYNLHLKFKSESTVSVSRPAFYRMRPKHIALVNFASRSVCLCSKHQNFCFLLRSLKGLNVTTCTNPDKFVQMYRDSKDAFDEMLNKVPDDEDVKFQQWKRVKQSNGKERQRVVEVNKSKPDFVEMMKYTFAEFDSHIQRVNEQYCAVKQLKDKLPANQVVVQMDFSENYSCTTLEEIQSAYWNSNMVTLHPVVIYYGCQHDDTLKHNSYVYVSEVLNHNAAMVISIVDKIVKEVKQLVPGITTVHFWTDSPSSQYRNKTIFDMVSQFNHRYGILATWHYFESGHGKGPCDGVGGTTKRNADNAVKQGKALIQDATDFYEWATRNEKGIKYDFVTEDEYNNTKLYVDKRNDEIKPLKGTMKIHAVVGLNDGQLATRNTTCVCDDCFDGESFRVGSKCGWNKTVVELKNAKKSELDIDRPKGIQTEEQADQRMAKRSSNCDLVEEKFVVARYTFDKNVTSEGSLKSVTMTTPSILHLCRYVGSKRVVSSGLPQKIVSG